MVNDAINCLYEGLASPEDVDQMMKLGANHQIGPPSLADLIGLDTMETLYTALTTRSTARARCSSRCATPATSAGRWARVLRLRGGLADLWGGNKSRGEANAIPQCRSIPTGHCRARIGQARSGREPHAGFDEAKRDRPWNIFRKSAVHGKPSAYRSIAAV